MLTVLLMGPEASLQGTTRLYLTKMIQGATLAILVVAPQMLGAPLVVASLPPQPPQGHLRRMSPLL